MNDDKPISPEHEALIESKKMLERSIAGREAAAGESPDHRAGTDAERARLREIEARIREITNAATE